MANRALARTTAAAAYPGRNRIGVWSEEGMKRIRRRAADRNDRRGRVITRVRDAPGHARPRRQIVIETQPALVLSRALRRSMSNTSVLTSPGTAKIRCQQRAAVAGNDVGQLRPPEPISARS